MSISQNFPATWPSLTLDFANSKVLDPRVTFTRGSTGTYVGADGLVKTAAADQARFDHDPATGESLGLLVEESRTNLLQYSIPDNTNWTNSASSLSINNSTSPDGTLTATLFTGIGDNTVGHYTYRNQSVTSGVIYTQTFFVKAGTTEFVQIAPSTGFNSRRANFQLTGEGVIGSYDTPVPPTIQKYPNGWYRIRVTETAILSTIGARMILASVDSLTSSRIPQSEPRTFYVWGAQLEAGAFPTSYIPTSGSAVPRSVDTAQITGTNFSSWYNALEGTILTEYYADTPVSEAPFSFAKTGAELTDLIGIGASSDGPIVGVFPSFVVSDSGVTQTGITVPIRPTTGDIIKTAVTYKQDDFAIYSATNTESGAATDLSGTIPTVDFALIGKYPYFGIWQNRPISRITYYPERLTNSQLQNLTK